MFAPSASLVALQAKMQPPASLVALQAKMQPPASPMSSSDILAAAKQGTATSGQELPHHEAIQSAFGQYDIGGIAAHVGTAATAASEAIGAQAFTLGSHVAFSGAPSLHTAAHEAAHVIQQRAGVHLKDGVGRPGDKYERHADAVADCVVRGESAESLLSAFAPSSTTDFASTAPVVQGEWISRHKDKSTLYRYWNQIGTDTIQRDNGWYKLENAAGTWTQADNVKLAGPDQAAKLPTQEDILPGAVVSHTTRYDPNNITADPVSPTAQTKINNASLEVSNLDPALKAKVMQHGETLTEPQKVYRWGEYQFEKNYVKNNGFQLGNVNFGSSIYGPGLYVATTPWGSAEYATPKDGSIIEVTIPTGTFFLNSDSQAFDRGEQDALWRNPRFPQFLMVSKHSGWATIKDDNLNLKINFYRPDPEELGRIAPHLQSKTSIDGYIALQIINRQLGNPIYMPPEDQMLAMFINQPEMKRQKVQEYIRKISHFDFVPFMLSEGELDFTEAVEEFLGGLDRTSRYRKHFDDIELTLRTWAKEPFSLSQSDFNDVILTPFTNALEAYKKERDTIKATPTHWYTPGWKLKYATGKKHADATKFRSRLMNFGTFLSEVDSRHSDLATTEKDSHVGVKVGRHRGMLPKNIEKDARKEAIAEMMTRGVPKVRRMTTPQAIIMMGLPGSGKSSVIREIAPDIEKYVVADPDEAKSGLPEYQAGIKAKNREIAGKVHDESKAIAEYAIEQTWDSRQNVIYDSTGTGVRDELLRNLRSAGYHIKLVYVHVAYDTAKNRVAERAKATGRNVPDFVMGGVRQMLWLSLTGLARLADTVLIYDNESKDPKLVWSGTGRTATLSKLEEELDKLSKQRR